MFATETTTVATMKTRRTARFVRKASFAANLRMHASPPQAGAMESAIVPMGKMRHQVAAHRVPTEDTDAIETSAVSHIGPSATCVGTAMGTMTKTIVLQVRHTNAMEGNQFQSTGSAMGQMIVPKGMMRLGVPTSATSLVVLIKTMNTMRRLVLAA